MDQLAEEYADQPVVFLEQDVDNTLGDRYGRWWAAYGGGGSATLPLVMVDSGHQISNGYVDFYNTYRDMVDAELARPPQAEIEAYSQRISNMLHFDIQLRNLSGVTLSRSSNSATVHAIVYEDAHVGVTDRIVRAAVPTDIAFPLAHGATMTFTLETELSGVDWDKIHSVVLVDYRPGGSSGAYDVLQATLALTCVLFGDFDNSGQVDLPDVMRVASRWRTSCEVPNPDHNDDTPNYDSLYDIDGDCDIDIVDIMLVVKHWGETCE